MRVIRGDEHKKPVFMGGTFSANPLVMHVAKIVLQHLIENRGTVYTHLNESGRYIRNAINEFCAANRVPVRMTGIGSMSRMIFTDKPIKSRRTRDRYESDDALQKQFYLYLLLEKGVYVSSNRIIFLSTAHRKEDVNEIAESIISTLRYFSKNLTIFQ